MTGRHAASPDDIEMSSVFSALKKSLPKLLLWSALLGGLTYGAMMMLAPKYQSQAEIQIEAKGSSSAFSDPKSSGSGTEIVTTKMDKEAINTHVRALQSPDLMAKIADEMKLNEKREFNSAKGPVDFADTVLRLVGVGGPRPGESERDRVLGALFKQTEVYSAKESRFIGVRVTSIDPALAADIANKISETYRNSLASAVVTEIDDQQKVLKGKIEKLTPEVAAAETEVQRYRGQIDSFKGGNQNIGMNEQQMSELNGELTKAKAARGESDARAKSAREMMKLGSADALPDVQKSPLIQNLVQQRVRLERQISELSASLLPGHPRMRQLNGDLAGLKRQLTGEISKIVDSLDKEAKIAQGREESIKKSLDELKTKVVKNAPEEAKLQELEASVKAKKTELENLQAQVEANRKRQDARAQPVEAKIISKAQAASLPISPKKSQNAALISFASLLFGTFWTITRALFTGARSGGRTLVEPNLTARAATKEEPVLSAKAAKAEALKSESVTQTESSSRVESSISSVVERIKRAAPKEGGHRAMVSGETMVIDASQEAIDIAKGLADGGSHVILVDWSPSGQGMSAAAGVTAAQGLTELVTGAVGFDEVVQKLPQSQVHFIACGAPLDGVDVDPDQLNLVLDALDEAYDYIVVSGQTEEARVLFEAIQGRFDAGVLVTDPKKRTSVLQDPLGTFLGFEVTDIDVIRIDRKGTAPVPNQRIIRATKKAGAEARTG